MTTYETDGQGKFIPASQRPDGSWRKPRRVRDGYVPQEEVPLYESKGKLFAQKPTAAATAGLPVGMCPQIAQQERAKREKAKQQTEANKQKLKQQPVPGLLVMNEKKTSGKLKAAGAAELTLRGGTAKPKNNIDTIDELADNVADMQIDIEKKLKKLKKKLREIDSIEDRIKTGELKNPEKDQLDKISRRSQILREISQLEFKQN